MGGTCTHSGSIQARDLKDRLEAALKAPGGNQSGREDLNLRPHGPEPCALTGLRYSPNTPISIPHHPTFCKISVRDKTGPVMRHIKRVSDIVIEVSSPSDPAFRACLAGSDPRFFTCPLLNRCSCNYCAVSEATHDPCERMFHVKQPACRCLPATRIAIFTVIPLLNNGPAATFVANPLLPAR